MENPTSETSPDTLEGLREYIRLQAIAAEFLDAHRDVKTLLDAIVAGEYLQAWQEACPHRS